MGVDDRTSDFQTAVKIIATRNGYSKVLLAFTSTVVSLHRISFFFASHVVAYRLSLPPESSTFLLPSLPPESHSLIRMHRLTTFTLFGLVTHIMSVPRFVKLPSFFTP